MSIKYVGPTSGRIRGRAKRQNIERWMYVPEPKYKPAWGDIVCAAICIITIVFTVAFVIFATLSMKGSVRV